jgi:hypothetical protein
MAMNRVRLGLPRSFGWLKNVANQEATCRPLLQPQA